jgi:hypothetical protein
MRRLQLSASLLTFLDVLEYVEAGLSADEETKDLAKPFHEELGGWEGVFKKEREGRRGVTRAEAVLAVRNAQLDGHTLKFGASVLAEAGGDRKGAFFRRFFTVAPSSFVRQPLRKQCEHTLHVVLAEIDKLDKKSPLRAFGGSLGDMAKAALKALDARNKAKADRTTGGNDVDEWKEGVNALLLTTYAELLKIAADKGYSRAWADSFFPSDSAGASDAAAPGDAGAPGEAAGGAAPAAGGPQKEP